MDLVLAFEPEGTQNGGDAVALQGAPCDAHNNDRESTHRFLCAYMVAASK